MPRGKKGSGPKAKKAEKTGVLALALKASEKALKKPKVNFKVDIDHQQLLEPLPHVPTGSIVIDYLIGGEPNRHGIMPCPGIPRCRITQLWGHESSGKTTLALTAAATCCAQGGTVVFIDWENAIVPDYADALGVPVTDDSKFHLLQPETLEDGVKLAMIYAVAGVDLIIFDSIGAAVPARIANRELADVGEQSRVGELQAVWSQELPNLRNAIGKKGAAIIGISQIRARITTGPSYGPKTQPQGGNAWKFYSDVRLELRRYKQEKTKLFNVLTHKTDDRVIGNVIRCKVVKCKLSSSQGREELFYIRWGEGIDDMRSVMEIGIAHGIIHRGGAWLTWSGPSGEIKGQGVNAFREKLRANNDDYTALYNAVTPFLGSKQFAEDELEELDDVGDLLAAVEGVGKKDDEPAKPEESEENTDGFDDIVLE